MVQPCCYCGIPLQRAAQYVGIADVILGLLNFIVMVIHVKELYEGTGSLYSHESDYLDRSHRSRTRHVRTFPGLQFLPVELAMTILVCHGIQLIMGVALYFGAVNKNRNCCLFWLGVTAVTALFTGLFIRLYEMLIVNEFAHELKMEQEVTYFPGQNPIQVHLQPYHHHPHQPTIHHQPIGNPLVPSADSHLSAITIPSVTPAPFNNHPHTAAPEVNPTTGGYYYGQYPSMQDPQYPQYQYQHIPAALQPPPYYEVAVNGGTAGVSTINGQGSNGSTGYTVQSVVTPNEKNDYTNTFSKF